MLRKYKDYILLLLLFLSILFISNISYFIMPNNIDVNSIIDDYTKHLESEYNELLKINNIDYNANLNKEKPKHVYIKGKRVVKNYSLNI